MRMPESLADNFNDQITLELASSLAYLQMSAYFESRSLKGMAAWMRAQSQEERTHALKFFDFVLDRGNEVRIRDISAPTVAFDSPLAAFEAALAQEEAVSAAIKDLYRAASDETDTSSFPLLQWFLEEQVEEEATVSEIVDQLELIGDDGGALLLLDRELGGRTAATATSE